MAETFWAAQRGCVPCNTAPSNCTIASSVFKELIEVVTFCTDRPEVTVTGATPVRINLNEVDLRGPGTGTLVSEGDYNP